jgi:hypothetical protein
MFVSFAIAVCLAMAATPSWAGGEPAPAPPRVGRPKKSIERLRRLSPGLERFATHTSKEMVAELKKLGPGFTGLADHPWLDPRMGQFIEFVKARGLERDGPKLASWKFRDFLSRQSMKSGELYKRRKTKAEIFALERGEQATRHEFMTLLGAAGTPEQLAHQLYGEHGARAVEELKQLSPGFERLVIHPGLVTRLSEFKKFVKDKDLEGAEPKRALDAFRDFLGTKLVYRALALPPGGVEEVLAHGMDSIQARAEGWRLQYLATPPEDRQRWELENGAPYHLADIIDERVSGSGRDVLLSVGELPNVAIAAAGNYAPDKKGVTLFTLRVPTLDVFHPGASDSVLPSKEVPPRTLILNGSKNETRYAFPNPAVESFMLYKIGPEEIVEHQTIDPQNVPDYEISLSPPPPEATPQ